MAGLCWTTFVYVLCFRSLRGLKGKNLGFYQPTERFCHLQLIFQHREYKQGRKMKLLIPTVLVNVIGPCGEAMEPRR